MTAKVQTAERHQPDTSSLQRATPSGASLPTSKQVQPAEEPEVYWGDKVALRVWVFSFPVMWMIDVLDFIAGIWSR
jgi:hypothetical protein